jgi:hypothetical protein
MKAMLRDVLPSVCDSNSVALQHMCQALGFPFAQCWLQRDGRASGILFATSSNAL